MATLLRITKRGQASEDPGIRIGNDTGWPRLSQRALGLVLAWWMLILLMLDRRCADASGKRPWLSVAAGV